MPRRLILTSLLAMICTQTAHAAGSTSGSSALAFAALVGLHAPLPSTQKTALAQMLDGRLPVHARGKITITATSVTCRASNVDLSEHDCTLVFGSGQMRLNGRVAHELYATLVEVGVPSDGAAGSIYEAVSNLTCTVDPEQVNQKAGGGADCSYKAGPGS